jgi:hypothetical protein
MVNWDQRGRKRLWPTLQGWSVIIICQRKCRFKAKQDRIQKRSKTYNPTFPWFRIIFQNLVPDILYIQTKIMKCQTNQRKKKKTVFARLCAPTAQTCGPNSQAQPANKHFLRLSMDLGAGQCPICPQRKWPWPEVRRNTRMARHCYRYSTGKQPATRQ